MGRPFRESYRSVGLRPARAGRRPTLRRTVPRPASRAIGSAIPGSASIAKIDEPADELAVARNLIGTLAQWAEPVDEAEMIGVPELDVLAIAGRLHRNDAVVGALVARHHMVRYQPFRVVKVAVVPAGNREVADRRGVNDVLVEDPAFHLGEIVERLHRHADEIEHR